MSQTNRMMLRYRYRAYPTPVQAQMLARTFGCARVVFNDVLRTREQAHVAGEKISDNEIQRLVVTSAKTTPERAWLADVSAVALVQACRDAHQAYRNFFNSISGKRKGRKVGHPRFRSKKDSRQSIRLTRSGFGATARGVRVTKVGDMKLKWSRSLPSIPSSVTIIQEPDGRYYASFVVAVETTPLPVCAKDVGLDLGIETLIATSDGALIANPRYLQSRQRRLANAQRSFSRKQKGSSNREKARIRGAVQHRKVREARADYLHKQALRLIRENQAVYIEDLAVSGLARTRLARSVHDASWSIFVGLLQEKATRYGRSVVKVGRHFPSSQLCSACGHRDGPKPLSVRSWTCAQCGISHHRDINAARNILVEGRRVAAGQAETINARGENVRLGSRRAVLVEAGTLRGAA